MSMNKTSIWRAVASALGLAVVLSAHVMAAPAELPMRLGDAAVPLAYKLDLKLDPRQARHSGSVEIDVRLAQASTRIRLHAEKLKLQSVRFVSAGHSQTGHVQPADADSVYLQFDHALPAGEGKLLISFSGEVSDKDVLGIFRQHEGADWYAITQFEDLGARRAFPVFDEPGRKVPWTLALTVPAEMLAVANTPIQTQRPAGRGLKRIEFKTSPPLPSYLLAFAVGPFDVLDGGQVGGKPLRYITPRGRKLEASYAASVTPTIIEHLQAYFGIAYPYEKLDSLVIPFTDNFSAMENPGLITYASRSVLAAPGQESPQFQRAYVSTAAHEIAHQWFGNYVTMAWWDDLWLNESFASWMGDKITAQVKPEWRWEDSGQEARRSAMAGDRLASARRIHQPVNTPADLGTAFDEITYSKGQSVLAMFETWLGEDAMRAGVRRYMLRHAWGNATGADFVAALGPNDAGLAAAFASFTEQAGIPRVRMTLRCEGQPRIELEQSRYTPLGAAAQSAALWQVPVTLRTPAGTTRHLLKTATASIDLPDAQCPAWLQPNVGGVGYYRTQMAEPLQQALLAQGGASTNELLALLDDQRALAVSGDVPMADLLSLVQQLAKDPRRELIEVVAETLMGIKPLLSEAQQAAYAQLWQASYGAQARALGWQPKPGEDIDAQQLRILLLPTVAEFGQDAVLRQQALTLAQSWLSAAAHDGQAHAELIGTGLRGQVLRTAAIHGDAKLFDAMLAVAYRSTERPVRNDLISALGAFADPALAARARELLFDAKLDIRESLPMILSQQSAQPALAADVLAFVEHKMATLRKRMASQAPAYLPQILGGGCSSERAQELQRVFAPLASQYSAGEPILAKTTERLQLCAAYRTAQAQSLDAYLKALPSSP